MAEETESVATVKKLAAAVNLQHEMQLLVSPTKHPSFHRLMVGIAKTFSRPRKPRLPLTKTILKSCFDKFLRDDMRTKKTTDLIHWRTIWRMTMEFFGLLRWDEVHALRRKDLLFKDNHLVVRIARSKTDQYRQGMEVLIAADAGPYCPVRFTREYLDRLHGSQDEFLQPRILSVKKKGSKFREQRAVPTSQVSYTTALEDLRHVIASVGLNPSMFGEHSGKRGGASAAGAAGASKEGIKQTAHGVLLCHGT
jgi:integrase